MSECVEVLEQMEIEIYNMQDDFRVHYSNKLMIFNKELQECKKSFKYYNELENRKELFEDTRVEKQRYKDELIQNKESNSLLADQHLHFNTLEKLKQSQKALFESETIGGGILENLRSQKEMLLGNKDSLHNADGHIDYSLKLLLSISRRIIKNRILSYAIILILIILILLVIYSKSFKN